METSVPALVPVAIVALNVVSDERDVHHTIQLYGFGTL